MAKVIIFGAGQISELAHFYLTNDSEHEVVGFTIDKSYRQSDRYKNLPLVDFESLEEHFAPDEVSLFIPISYRGVNSIRRDRYENAKARGYGFVSYLSSKATYYDTPVGENCFIFEDNTIQPFTRIGNNVFMWSGNHLGHHSVIEDHCFITSHVVISGDVVVGEQSFIGVNACLRDGISIGRACVIGAGSTIVRNLPDETVTRPEKAVISKVKSSALKSI